MKVVFALLCSTLLFSAYAAQLKDTTFLATTNVGGVSISGKVGNLKGDIQNFVIPLKKIKTGVGLRDKHMCKKIFKDEPVRFKGKVTCLESCFLVGNLIIAKVTKEVKIKLKKRSEKSFSLSHVIKLSEFKIERPSFAGVEVKDEVRISSNLFL